MAATLEGRPAVLAAVVTTTTAADSTYAGIVRLASTADAAGAAAVRLADRYAVSFLAVTLAVAGGAWALVG